MSALYYNDHSITFIETNNSYKRSWYDFGLIPVKSPSVSPPPPRLKIIEIPGSSNGLDLTGTLTFGRRTGQWEFYVDTSKWSSWSLAKRTIENFINGQSRYVVLEDEHDRCYMGRLAVVDWSNESGYPKVTIAYDFAYGMRTNDFNYSLVPTLLSISSSLRSGAPNFYIGDPKDKARKWITTIATYDNGWTEKVDINKLSGDFVALGTNTLNTTYKNKSSSVSVNVIEALVLYITSLLKSTAPDFYVGDTKDSVRSWLDTTAYCEDGIVKNNVMVDPFTGEFKSPGIATLVPTYQNKSTQVLLNILERRVIGIWNELKSGQTNYVWQGSNKNDIKTKINTRKIYENNYRNGDPIETEPVTGIFDTLGSVTVPIVYKYNDPVIGTTVDLTDDFEVNVDIIQSINITRRSDRNNLPAYVRVGEWKRRMRYYLRAMSTTYLGRTVTYTDNNLTLQGGIFSSLSDDSVEVQISNNGVGEYEDTLTGSFDFEVRPGFDIIDSWETVNQAIANGTYASQFNIGDLIPLEIEGLYNGYAQIVGFDVDYDENGESIPISWMLKETLDTTRQFNSINDPSVYHYANSDLKTYVDYIESILPSQIKNMIIPSMKEYCQQFTPNKTISVLKLKTWVPSLYEIIGSSSYHDISNRSVSYTSFFETVTDRIKYRNYHDASSGTIYINPINWWSRDSLSATVSSYAVRAFTYSGMASFAMDSYCGIVIGFCTGATEYDENPDWILKKFRENMADLKYYKWDTFGLDSASDRNNIFDAVDAELSLHVIQNPTQSSQMEIPAVTFSMTSQSPSSYTYNIKIYEPADDNKVSTRFETRFNLVRNSSTLVDDHYVYDYTLTTHKMST